MLGQAGVVSGHRGERDGGGHALVERRHQLRERVRGRGSWHVDSVEHHEAAEGWQSRRRLLGLLCRSAERSFRPGSRLRRFTGPPSKAVRARRSGLRLGQQGRGCVAEAARLRPGQRLVRLVRLVALGLPRVSQLHRLHCQGGAPAGIGGPHGGLRRPAEPDLPQRSPSPRFAHRLHLGSGHAGVGRRHFVAQGSAPRRDACVGLAGRGFSRPRSCSGERSQRHQVAHVDCAPRKVHAHHVGNARWRHR
mmetsp:Transcript_26613/g.100148  ORF Transcript_26613/g.100148 Transcript_26613/m.100148 type:complete len:249 (+) Transcript_26613:1526-2272(+)